MQLTDRRIIVRKTFEESRMERTFVQGTMSERISLVWELTRWAWAMTGNNVEQRLQRHVTVLVGRRR
jgi:hypothetical protein